MFSQNLEAEFLTSCFSVGSEIKINFLGNRVGEEVKELVLVDLTVRLLWVRKHNSVTGRLN